jgi:ATP-grasp ribosomal peptide maturase
VAVIVLTDKLDPTADLVVERLNDHDTPVFRFDTAEFPQRIAVAAEFPGASWSGYLRTDMRRVEIDEVTGLYYRRPTTFEFPDHLSGEERRWSALQARLGLGGLLSSLEPWLNHPHRIGYAEYKPAQLAAAQDVGLHVPRTLVTNVPEAARQFVTSVGRAVCKPFGGSGIVDDEGGKQTFAEIVTVDDCVDSVAGTMHLFQEWVPKTFEVRVTVVDTQQFAARIDALSDAAHLDWRSDYAHVQYGIITVPPVVRRAVDDFMRRQQLRFGAFDFAVDGVGRWWFLECNPNGQWGWIEEATGLPIAEAIAQALEGGRHE